MAALRLAMAPDFRLHLQHRAIGDGGDVLGTVAIAADEVGVVAF